MLYQNGFKPPKIAKIQSEEGLPGSREEIHKFLRKFQETGCLNRHPGSGRPSKLTVEIQRLVEEQMKQDDETTAYQLHALLLSKGYIVRWGKSGQGVISDVYISLHVIHYTEITPY